MGGSYEIIMINISVKQKGKIYLIDMLFLILVIIAFGSIFMVSFYGIANLIGQQEFLKSDVAFSIVQFVCVGMPLLGYFVPRNLYFKNGSIGCKILRVTIVNEQGGKPTKTQLLARGVLSCFIPIFDSIFAKSNVDNLSLTDMLTKTRQVKIDEYRNLNNDI